MKVTGKTVLFYLLFSTAVVSAQEKMITKIGKITFEASVPSFEEVKAKNGNVTCVLNPKNGEIVTAALIKDFRFKVALMEVHFNENYMESDRYPKATFKGRIEDFGAGMITTTSKEYNIKGKLEIHGKSKAITIPARIRKTDGGIEITSNFSINADDYAISIPSIVKSKVSNQVNVRTEFTVQ